ncbi:hypothetical protein H5410_050878 [Solanum commersonii]|uniref:Uncharacterized protein n=1 Tax=Solanum commersonii TaxID=4109 RepID=A0A9J5WWS5_SOLCO|nr:hypothetical protein H5410_050878 [Solanum commersonii]
MAKVKVQVDLTKTRPRHVWIGLDEKDLTIGRWQSIEYENIPPYCVYCKHQGYTMDEWNDNKQTKKKEQEEPQQQNIKERDNQHQHVQQKEEEWQVQRRKNNKPQEERIQKIVWKPTSAQYREKQNLDMHEPNNDEGMSTQGVQNRSKVDHNQKTQAMQRGNKANSKNTGIDSMLPIPISPNTLYPNGIVEVEGGMDGGWSKGGNLTHVIHEGTHFDHSPYPRAPATTTVQHPTSDQQQGEQQKEGEVCKKFIMVDEQLGMDITPRQTQYMYPPLTVPPDSRSEKCQMNKGPIIDEYVVDNSEDGPDVDNQSLKDPDEDDETSELLIRAFSPHPDKSLADEIQQVANNQGLSPRGLHHDRFQFKTQDINTVTAGRTNTRLFTSRSSQ